MRPLRRLSLAQLFAVALVAVASVIAVLSTVLVETARHSLIDRSERFREAAATRIGHRVAHDLGEAGEVLGDIEQSIRAGVVVARTPEDLEAALFAELLAHPRVADVTLTHAVDTVRWQISLFRAKNGGIATRIVRLDSDQFVADLRERAPGAGVHDGLTRTEGARDPTEHLTFQTAASADFYGKAIWSDLHFSELDGALPEADRRIVVSVQKAIDDAHRRFVGVVRVGLLATAVDDLAKLRIDDADPNDPHRVFLCDAKGLLLTRLTDGDRLSVVDDNLRVAHPRVPPEIVRALASPVLARVSPGEPLVSDAFAIDGHRFLATYRALEDSQGWIVGIVVPEEHYTRDLRLLRDRFLVIGGIGAALALLAAGVVLRMVRGGFRRLLATTSRMRRFDFAAEATGRGLRDVDEVADGLERAKTAVRALGKYVPIDLVRDLYAANREPALGSRLETITLMFTDIEGFTTLAEKLDPNALARALGAYLEAMTSAIRGTGGTIDKFIGDAVMAMWNAPSPVADHATQACRAALACVDATRALYASDAWNGLAPLVTRFGLHTDTVLVGNFGAPARLSFTAVGDGVNLAARLEGLCKTYGVTMLASEAVEREARSSFAFRRVDRVAVKGKSRAVLVFELLGPVDTQRSAAVEAYDAALDDYFARDFARAVARLEPSTANDAPSRVLADRCRAFLAQPPPGEWDGTWVARSK